MATTVRYRFYGDGVHHRIYQAIITRQGKEKTFEGSMEGVNEQVQKFARDNKVTLSELDRVMANAVYLDNLDNIKKIGGGILNRLKKTRRNRKSRKTMRRRKSKKTMGFMF